MPASVAGFGAGAAVGARGGGRGDRDYLRLLRSRSRIGPEFRCDTRLLGDRRAQPSLSSWVLPRSHAVAGPRLACAGSSASNSSDDPFILPHADDAHIRINLAEGLDEDLGVFGCQHARTDYDSCGSRISKLADLGELAHGIQRGASSTQLNAGFAAQIIPARFGRRESPAMVVLTACSRRAPLLEEADEVIAIEWIAGEKHPPAHPR